MTNLTKEFYDQICFPGVYTQKSLQYHWPKIRNPYLAVIDSGIKTADTVLDVGCGSGLVTNLFAQKYTDKKFTALDFAAGVDYARQFSIENNIQNTNFVKISFDEFATDQKFDTVVCQGVLHHMPNWKTNINKLKDLVNSGGTLILGLYHPWGKIAKRYGNINYGNDVLQQDQEHNPYETAFSCAQTQQLLRDQFTVYNAYPSTVPAVAAIRSLFNYRNGGLVTSCWKKNV
jgi:ubiquinone/menaquinone biosynthesis C-methylase UbiE